MCFTRYCNVFLWFTSFKFSDFLFQSHKEKSGGLFCNGDESWAVMVWFFTAVPGAHYTGKPQQTNATRNACHWKIIMFVLCPKYRDLSLDCRVWTKWRVEWWMRTKFRRWWGILWAFHTSICCEGVNLRKKLPSKLKNCAVSYSFSTRDCGEFGAGEKQSKRF